MRALSTLVVVLSLLSVAVPAAQAKRRKGAVKIGPVSELTQACLACHRRVSPGITADWESSRHARVTPAQALTKPTLERRVSAEKVPAGMAKHVVGCAECHIRKKSTHKDTFDHFGYRVHVIPSPKDCAVCHPTERDEYDHNLMARAYKNLMGNSLYRTLVNEINGVKTVKSGKVSCAKATAATNADSCLQCHGTVVKVVGTEQVPTVMGTIPLPKLTGWPNQGVGRINPDGTRGACTPCHPRHSFSIEVARKPETCAQCHKGPDVPAYPVYKVSKHGNIYAAMKRKWKWNRVPWTVGKDFTAPTCASCHMSLVVGEAGNVVSKRSHRMNERLPWRLFGLVYAHPHPKSPDTTIIRNKAGLPLPTDLNGDPAEKYVIGTLEQAKRKEVLFQVCLSCHGRSWVKGWYARLENTISTTNRMVLASTKLMAQAWKQGLAKGLAQKDGIFNEAVEKMWADQWLFYANTTRFASAMAGADYGVFANGRYHMAKNVRSLEDWLKVHSALKKAKN